VTTDDRLFALGEKSAHRLHDQPPPDVAGNVGNRDERKRHTPN
jgi:hypothetical protein